MSEGSTLITRYGDPYVHLGPPGGLAIPTTSPLWQTRCGLGASAGPWGSPLAPVAGYCPDCLAQAGLR